MPVMNTPNRYGFFTKFLHWIIAIVVLVQFYLAYWTICVLPPKSPTGSFYINNLHKPIGMLALCFIIVFIFWRIINIKPNFPPAMANWEIKAAKLVHFLLYLTVLIMPISGLIMSVAAGYPPNFFGLYQVPAFLEKNKEIADFFFKIHGTTGLILAGLVVIHTLAALKHHFINRDFVLKRIL
jgi:cytochrome b561